jgi:phytoene/squalene synthetase
MYAVMRIVDDRVDELAVSTPLSSEKRHRESDILQAWHAVVSACLAGKSPPPWGQAATDHPDSEELTVAFTAAVNRFPVPPELWDDFFSAMQQDLVRDRFATYIEFVDYARGATVSPTTLYLYLITAERHRDRSAYYPPTGFDLRGCGHNLGLFAYIAHILRDLPEDLAAGECGLLYLAADDMAAHGVTEAMLSSDLAAQGTSPPVRLLVRTLIDRAKRLACLGRAGFQPLYRTLSTDRRFVLELIVRMYEEQLNRIVACSHDVMSGSHKLSSRHKKRIARTLATQMATQHQSTDGS